VFSILFTLKISHSVMYRKTDRDVAHSHTDDTIKFVVNIHLNMNFKTTIINQWLNHGPSESR
jgi:hypothetical protein